MDLVAIMVLGWFFLFTPIFGIQLVLQYMMIFHHDKELLWRMIYHMDGKEQELAEAEEKSDKRRFLGFFALFYLLSLSALAALYILSFEVPGGASWVDEMFTGFGIVVVVGAIATLASITPSADVRSWKRILQQRGIHVDSCCPDMGFSLYRERKKVTVVASSFFRNEFPGVNRHLLPELRFSLFRPVRREKRSGIDLDLNVKRDLKEAGLWPKEKESLSYVAAAVAIVALLASIAIAEFYVSDLTFSLDQDTELLMWSALAVFMVSISLFALLSAKYSMPNARKYKLILDQHHIVYSEDTYEQELLDLLEKHYPYVPLG